MRGLYSGEVEVLIFRCAFFVGFGVNSRKVVCNESWRLFVFVEKFFVVMKTDYCELVVRYRKSMRV